MRAKQLRETLEFSIKNRFPVLIKGSPGIGKTDIVTQSSAAMGADLIVSHPVVSDPTDFKGLPFPNKDGSAAKFLPFGDLLRLIEADKPTVFFLDDLGQASASVQAAAMQLLLARRINGHAVSDHVVFLAATNRRQDRAAVQGILEPVKSRFAAILELEVNTDDWVEWAIENDMPTELIAFIRFRPNLLHDFKPTADIINTPNPRTVANVGKMMNAGLPKDTEYEMISGAAGEAFATEFLGFLKVYRDLPDIDKLIADPENTDVPNEPSTLFAVCGALSASAAANKKNFGNIIKYTDRLPGEFQVLLIKDAIKRNNLLANTKEFSQWAIKHSDVIL
ncbi:MAG: ATP-binding protein [Candidatus Cloacimonetes bacterium]|nr:ATP-binding protein [Candidatus Cloacimonadota bacterium]